LREANAKKEHMRVAAPNNPNDDTQTRADLSQLVEALFRDCLEEGDFEFLEL
jgi:hypothetical protein